MDEDLQPISADEINLSVPAEIISRLASVLPFGASEQTARGAFSLDTTERAPLQCLYLTDNGQLYSSNGMITDNCTSCVVSPTGFVLTTVMTQGMFDLLFVHKLSEVGSLRAAIQRAPKTSSGKDHRLRNTKEALRSSPSPDRDSLLIFLEATWRSSTRSTCCSTTSST